MEENLYDHIKEIDKCLKQVENSITWIWIMVLAILFGQIVGF